MPRFAYETVDVFTDTRFGGNPLAVVLDARGLDDATMLAITREFNYSETTFILPPSDPANTARVRIFTHGGEVPFAGHPNVGTGYVLARQGHALGRPVGDHLRFEESAGLVAVSVVRDGDDVTGGRIRAPKSPMIGQEIGRTLVGPCVGLDASHISTANHPPVRASVGLPFVIAEVDSLAALERSAPDGTAFLAMQASLAPDACGESHLIAAYFYTRLPATIDGRTHVRARMFAPFDGIVEDPATGSAAGALGGLLATLAGTDDSEYALVIDQGIEMGRPSRIEVTSRIAQGAAREVFIAGRCVPVMRGELEC